MVVRLKEYERDSMVIIHTRVRPWVDNIPHIGKIRRRDETPFSHNLLYSVYIEKLHVIYEIWHTDMFKATEKEIEMVKNIYG